MSENTDQTLVTEKLTDWKNEPTYADLNKDFRASKDTHDKWMTKIARWNALLNVTGKEKVKVVEGRSAVQPKLIRRQAEWRYAALSEPFNSSDKIFKCEPVTFEDVAAARQNEMILNWQFRTKINRVGFIDDYVHTVVDEGSVVVRVGWKRSTITVKEPAPVFSFFPIQTAEDIEIFQQALDLKNSDPHTFSSLDPALKEAVTYYEETGLAVMAQQTGTEMVDVEKVLENRPTVTVLSPDNVYIDPSCQGDIEKAMFAIVTFETNKVELEKEVGRYKNLDKVDWDKCGPATDPNHSTNTPQDFQFKDPARKLVVAYEYWGFYDISGEGKLEPFVATWVGNTMIRMEKTPFADGKLPFVVATYMPVKRELFGEPDAEVLEDNQKILGAVTRGMIDLLGKSANGQQGFAKGMLDPLNRRKFDKGLDYEYNPGTNPNIGLIEHKYPELPQSALVMLNLQNQEAESMTGVKSFSGGISGESFGQVAAGIRGVLDAAAKREMSILRRLAEGIKNIGVKISSMNAQFLSETEVVRVTNEKFEEVKREDLVGNFDMTVDISTAEVDAAKAEDLSFMLQTLGPNSDFSMVRLLLAQIARLKRMPELAERLENWKPEPNPIADEKAKLELENLRLENEKIQSEIDKNRAEARAKMAIADKTDLDFVEQETGTKHARDMEKQSAQAQGNQALEVTKGLLRSRKEGEKPADIEAAIGFNELAKGADTGQTFSSGPIM